MVFFIRMKINDEKIQKKILENALKMFEIPPKISINRFILFGMTLTYFQPSTLHQCRKQN